MHDHHFRKHFSKLLQQGRSALDSSLLADFNEKRREKAHTAQAAQAHVT